MFVRDDWTLFRNVATLGQKAGVSPVMLVPLVMKELVDNALDAAGDCTVGTGPVDRSFFVEDQGPGIPGSDEAVASIFSFRRSLTSSKLYRLPTRGALGNGLRVVAGSIFASSGSLKVRTNGRILDLSPGNDGHTQILSSVPTDEMGTRVDVSFGSVLDVSQALLYANLAVRMKGVSRYAGKSSPWWYDGDSFFELLQASDLCLYDVLDQIGGKYPVGQARRDAGLPPFDVETSSLDRQTTEKVLFVLRASSKEPKPSVLGAVGEEALFHNGYSRKSTTLLLRPGISSIPARVPVVLEAWGRTLDRSMSPYAQIYVNRTPVCAHVGSGLIRGRSKEMWLSGCGLDDYFKAGRDPVGLNLCVTSPYMPITTDGKEPNLAPLLDEVRSVVESVVRKCQRRTSSGAARTTKIEAVVSLLPEAMSDASGRGKHRFSLRQLYYAVRPLLQEQIGAEEELTYTYFAQIVTKHEASIGEDLPGIYRDARGTLYHPHTGQSISVGTLSVERYERPKWVFNKILYIEKGGFFPLLVDEKWPERHDCALLTSQGFATRAARDVIDLLGDSDEPVRFYCIHDADAFGTNIHEKLVEATLARPARKVEVVNLGLEPWEAESMGLLPETLVRKDEDDLSVAPYIRQYDRENGTTWRDWLQHHRYELNAMNSPQFLEWLDGKMEGQDGKVVPPDTVLRDRYEEVVEEEARKIFMDRLARKHGVDDWVKDVMNRLAKREVDLRREVEDHLVDHEADPWKEPVKIFAEDAAIDLVGPET